MVEPPFATQWLIPCSYHRGGSRVPCRRKLFLRHTTDGTIGHSGGNERHLVGTDRDPVTTCKAFVKSVVVLFLVLYRAY